MTPDLTVVLLVDSQRRRGGWALRAILDQELDGELEVLLYDFALGELPPLAGSDHPAVRLAPGTRGAGYGVALAAAVHAARAPLVAFVEEHVVVRPRATSSPRPRSFCSASPPGTGGSGGRRPSARSSSAQPSRQNVERPRARRDGLRGIAALIAPSRSIS